MTVENENEFLYSIDCQFPYDDPARALALADQAVGISANAAFAVLYEVCFVPDDVDADLTTRCDVLARITKLLRHPLGKVILPLAADLLEGKRAPVPRQIETMRRVSSFPGQYSALQIALFAGEPEETRDEELDRVYDEIVDAWQERGQG